MKVETEESEISGKPEWKPFPHPYPNDYIDKRQLLCC